MDAKHSPDRRWWWDGLKWWPAVSADGTWWFDGAQWKPRRSDQELSTRLRAVGAAWLIALTAWEPALAITVAARATSPQAVISVGGLFGLTAVSATLGWGYLLAKQRNYRALRLSVLIGSAAVLGWYVALMIALAPSTDKTADTAAGFGVVIFVLPTLAGVAAMLGLGFAFAWIQRWLATRP